MYRITLILFHATVILSLFCLPVQARIGTTPEETEYLAASTEIITQVTEALNGCDITDTEDSARMYAKAVEFLDRLDALEIPTNNEPFWKTENFTMRNSLDCFIDGYDVSLSMEDRSASLYDAVQYAQISVLLLTNAQSLSQ